MNRTLKLLMVSDIFVLTGFGLIDPILAIFINDIKGGTIVAVGIATTLFWIVKSLVQLPFSKYVDRSKEKRTWLIIGTILIALIPFIYIYAKDIYWIYAAQIIHGIGSGLAFPTWLGLWSINLEKKKESFQWTLYSTLTSIGTAVTASIGAIIAEFAGFKTTFILVGIMSMIGCFILFWLEKEKNKRFKTSSKDYYKEEKLVPKEGY